KSETAVDNLADGSWLFGIPVDALDATVREDRCIRLHGLFGATVNGVGEHEIRNQPRRYVPYLPGDELPRHAEAVLHPRVTLAPGVGFEGHQDVAAFGEGGEKVVRFGCGRRMQEKRDARIGRKGWSSVERSKTTAANLEVDGEHAAFGLATWVIEGLWVMRHPIDTTVEQA